MTVFFGLKFRLRNIILSRLTTSSCSCMISRTGEGVSRIQLVGNVWSLEKSLQKSLKSLRVSQSHVKSGILYKLLYINVLSILLHYLLVI